MHERVAMNALDSTSRRQGSLLSRAKKRRALKYEERPETLATAEDCMANGFRQTRRCALALLFGKDGR